MRRQRQSRPQWILLILARMHPVEPSHRRLHPLHLRSLHPLHLRSLHHLSPPRLHRLHSVMRTKTSLYPRAGSCPPAWLPLQ